MSKSRFNPAKFAGHLSDYAKEGDTIVFLMTYEWALDMGTKGAETLDIELTRSGVTDEEKLRAKELCIENIRITVSACIKDWVRENPTPENYGPHAHAAFRAIGGWA